MGRRVVHLGMRTGEIYIGTSGWSYDWKGFYPKYIKKKDYFSYYTSVFDTTEINYSFYRLPDKKTYEKWAREAHDDFIFSLKLSRFITHIKRLKSSKRALRIFLSRTAPLGRKRGPLLVQLPPSERKNVQKLDLFLDSVRSIDRHMLIAVEFRDAGWYDDETYRIMKKHKAAVVLTHAKGLPYPEDEPMTANFAYVRLHGPGKMFASGYGAKRLKPWSRKVKKWSKEGRDVFVYFNNDAKGHAPREAQKLLEMAK